MASWVYELLELEAGKPHLNVALVTLVALSAGLLWHCRLRVAQQHEKQATPENEEDEEPTSDLNVPVIPQRLIALEAHDLSVQDLMHELAEVAERWREKYRNQKEKEYNDLVDQLKHASAKCAQLRRELQKREEEIRCLHAMPFSATFPWQIQVGLPWKAKPGAPWHVHCAQMWNPSCGMPSEPLTNASNAFYSFVADRFKMHANPFKITSIMALHSAEWQRAFEGRLQRLEERRHSGGVFQGTAFNDDPHKMLVKQRLLDNFLPRPPGVSLANTLYVWHGAKAEAIDGIAKTGFASLGTTDDGFFARGLYAAVEAVYACKYATGEILDVAHSSPWHVIFAVACMDAAYPVTRSDYDADETFCRLMGCDMMPGHSAHVAVVDPAMNWQAAMDPGSPGFKPMEVVLKTEEQIMPLAIVEFERDAS